MTESAFFYLNGQLLPTEQCLVSVQNRGYLLGEGIFETILIKDNEPRLLPAHLARLMSSAAYFGYKLPRQSELAASVYAVVTKNRLSSGSLRLTVSPRESRGLLSAPDSALDILISFRAGAPYAESLYKQGFTAIVAHSTRRNEASPLSRHKTTSFLDNVLARREAVARGVDEALLLNSRGYLAEGAVSNLFLVVDGEILTPRLQDGALPGIMRAQVVALCQEHSLTCREVELRPETIDLAQEGFLTNSLLGVMPLSRLEGKNLASCAPLSMSNSIRSLL